jgi:hypothetical protein
MDDFEAAKAVADAHIKAMTEMNDQIKAVTASIKDLDLGDLQAAHTLLTLLNEKYPPEGGQHHAIGLLEGKLFLSIAKKNPTTEQFFGFSFDRPQDLQMGPKGLFESIVTGIEFFNEEAAK